MAEVIGLVIGGVSLASLFDQCISIISYVDSGIHCGEACQDSALMLTMLGGRLCRWEHTYRNASMDDATVEDGENAEHLLKQIRKRLQDAEKLGERYQVETSGSGLSEGTSRSRAISSLVGELQSKIIKKRDGLSFGQKARWALRDHDKMNELIGKLDRFVTSLEQLFPSLHSQRIQTVVADAAEIVHTANMEGYAEVLEILKAAAARVDKDFDVAAASTSHVYRNIDINDRAMVNNANYYSEGWAKAGGALGKGGGHTYDGIRIGGDARVQNGDVFGGKSVFEV